MSDSDSQRPGNVIAGFQLYNNRYRVDMLLSVQSTRAVYRGYDLLQNKPVTILEMITLDQPRIQSALQNAHPLVELQHPSISTIQAAFFENNLFFLTFSISGGQMLTDILKERHDPIPESTAFRWIMQILEMLIFLETQTPDWHFGDLSPESIFITSEDRAQMLGFEIPLGLFEPWEMAADLPSGSVAPEMFDNICSAASDVYGVAVTLYYMLTNTEHSSDTTQHIAVKRPDLSLKLAKAIEKGYAEDPHERWQDPARFYDELLKTLPKDRTSTPENATESTVTLADLEEDSPTLVTNKEQMRAAIEAEAARAANEAQNTQTKPAENTNASALDEEASHEEQDIPLTEHTEHVDESQPSPETEAETQQPPEQNAEHIAEAGAAIGAALFAADALHHDDSHNIEEDTVAPQLETETHTADSADNAQTIEEPEISANEPEPLSDETEADEPETENSSENMLSASNEPEPENPEESASEAVYSPPLTDNSALQENTEEQLHPEDTQNTSPEQDSTADSSESQAGEQTLSSEEAPNEDVSQPIQETASSDETSAEEHTYGGAGAYIAGGIIGAGAAAMAAFALRNQQTKEHGHIINTPPDNSEFDESDEPSTAANVSDFNENTETAVAPNDENQEELAEIAHASPQETTNTEHNLPEPETHEISSGSSQDDEFADEEEPQIEPLSDAKPHDDTNAQEEAPENEWQLPQSQPQYSAEKTAAAAGLTIAALPLTKAAAKPHESIWGKFRALLQGSQTAAVSIATISLPKQMVASRQYHILARVQSQPLDKTRNHPNFLAIEVDAAQDVFYMPAQRVAIRLPADGGISEGSLVITAQRPSEGHKPDRVIFRITTPDGEVVHTGKNYVAECKVVDSEEEITDNSYITLTHGLDLM